MKKYFLLWVALLQLVFITAFYKIFQLEGLSYFIFAVAAIVQFMFLWRSEMRYFIWFTAAYAIITIILWFPVTAVPEMLSGLLWFLWIALFNFLICNMLRTEQYAKLFFGSFMLWIIAFGVIYAAMDFINILVLGIEEMPAKREISSFFMGHMKAGIVMGLGLGLGYDFIQLTNRKLYY